MSNITTENQSGTERAAATASQVANSATDQAGAVASTAKDAASSVAHDAKHEARRLASESRDQLREQANQQSQRLVQTMRDIGGQLDGMASGTAAPTGVVGEFTNQAASSVQRLADSLEQKGPQGVVSDVKRFARQRPGLFIVGALGAGLVVGRAIRALDTGALAQAAKPDSNGQQPALPTATTPSLTTEF